MSKWFRKCCIDSSGRVIIGATSVSPANSYSNNLVVSEASGDAGISMVMEIIVTVIMQVYIFQMLVLRLEHTLKHS